MKLKTQLNDIRYQLLVPGILGLVMIASWPTRVTAQDCPPGGMTFTSQAQIDAFPTNFPNCTMFTGDLLIQSSPPANITNLDGLSQLTSIGGNFRMLNSTGVTSMAGLSNVTMIGGHLYIGAANALKDFNGLQNLSSIGTYLQIANNRDLENLDALSHLTAVPGYAWILSNQSLESLDGLHNIMTIGGDLYIDNNRALTAIGDLGLTSVGGFVWISRNTELISVEGFSNLTSISGNLWIENNDALPSLAGLGRINPSGITNLKIEGNDNLSLCNVRSVCDYIAPGNRPTTITGNAQGCATLPQVQASCVTVSVDDTPTEGIRIHPNPTSGMLSVDAPDGSVVRTYNTLGHLSGVYEIQGGMIDVSSLSAGVHVLVYLNGELVMTQRFVKERRI